MPPKKNEPSKKTVEKQKQKIVEDKTFGLKNKKGNKQQRFIQQVEKQVVFGNKSAKELEKLKQEKDLKKDDKKKTQEELNALFRPVTELQKLGKGVDPKSVLCVFFKQGQCSKGDKCKFSHDLNVARKAEKRSLYDDASGAAGATEGSMGEGMEAWDQAKLEDVVDQKHGATNIGLPPTTIICKYFLDAVENSKYGWFWECPNGDKCHYRHALPPGFVLKKDKKKMEEQLEQISLEDLIERERMALGVTQTRVTLETFTAWQTRKRLEKQKKREEEKARKKADYKQGRTVGISGRELFEFNPDLVCCAEEMEEGGDVIDSRERECDDDAEYTGPIRDISLTDFACNGINQTAGADRTGERRMQVTGLGACGGGEPPVTTNGTSGVAKEDESDDEGTGAAAAACGAIDEELFNEADLDDLDDELNNLDVSHP